MILKDATIYVKKSFQIFVKTLSGRRFLIGVLEDESIKSLKKKIKDKEGLISVNIILFKNNLLYRWCR
jgi:predicted 2-oxoglutarate/Fe(II)-dependent dioxygenase YbiX